MSLAKLKRIHVIIIGSVLCVMAATAMFFLLIKPKQEAYKAAEARYNAAKDLGNQVAEDKAIRELNQAILEANIAKQALDAQMKRRMPDLSFASRDIGMLALWNEQIKTLGPLLERFARDQNVNVLSANFSIPPPPVNPNDPIFDQDVLVFPLGEVQVAGNFKNLMNNIRRWNNCRRLVMVGPPQLQGTSPSLVMRYSVTCYIFPVAKGGPQIPIAGSAQAQAGQMF
ncbi:MAG: hypothetical protein ACUVRS_09525 [Armatimonadota bacterium]